MQLLGSPKKDIDKNKDGKLVTINKHLKYYLLLYQINNLVNQLLSHFWFTDQNKRPLEIEDNVNII